MSFSSEIKSAEFWGRQVAHRPVQAITATPTNLFQVVGGPVKLVSLTAYLATAITTGVTWHIIACGVPLDAALFAAIGNIGENVAWPLGGVANVAPAAVSPSPSLLDFAAGVIGVILTPGSVGGDNFVLTYAVALIDGTVSFSAEFYRLSPASNIIPL
jgi:hypothetical protein